MSLSMTWQIKALWSTFQREVSQGVPPVVCSSTATIANTLLKLGTQQRSPPYRVHQSLPAVEDGNFAAKLPSDMINTDVLASTEGPSNVTAPLPATKPNNVLPLATEALPPRPPLADVKTSAVVMAPTAFDCHQSHVVVGGMNGSGNGSYVLPPSKKQHHNPTTLEVLLLSSKTVTFGVDTAESKSLYD